MHQTLKQHYINMAWWLMSRSVLILSTKLLMEMFTDEGFCDFIYDNEDTIYIMIIQLFLIKNIL